MTLGNLRSNLEYLASGGGLKWRLDAFLQMQLEREAAALHAAIRDRMPDNPAQHGFKVYSQCDEDGIIQAILSRIPHDESHRAFLEIGCGDGLENNTHALALQGHRGYWIDGSADNCNAIRGAIPALEGPGSPLRLEAVFVEPDNVGAIVERACAHLRTNEPLLFSIDIDGNDLVVMREALRYFTPKVVCVEYNAKFPPPMRLSIPYEKGFSWKRDDFQGASLQSFCDALPDYRLVACGIAGTNAFFVRNACASAFADYAVADIFQPPRYHLIHLCSGHPPSFKWLQAAIESAKP